MLSIFNNNYKEEFKNTIEKKGQDLINKNLNYILNNYKVVG